MSQGSESKRPAMDDLSALMDGELEASAVGRACSQWREDDETRANWHAYHLIGDVLRSDDLASEGVRDAAFLAAFRQRLAQEPVVLAPASVASSVTVRHAAKRRLAWAAPAAVAAGFMAVAGVLVVTQMSGGGGDSQPDSVLAASREVGSGMVAVSAGSSPGLAAETPVVVLNGQLIRDVRLDEYLAAHKKFGGSSVPGGPSGFLRNAAADGSAR
ncbi:MAG TPA: sigma-E factor negative regulatory protein [Rhizobacter sp.]|nr:sigma-E factor negative regulatory protein [Rhizobacter sp.]